MDSKQWTDKTTQTNFIERLEPVLEHMKNLEINRKNQSKQPTDRFGSAFTRPLLLPSHTLPQLDTFVEAQRGDNDAYLTIGASLPQGYALRRACPNYHDSRLTWIRALHGGGTLDYSDVYISAAHDDDEPISALLERIKAARAVDPKKTSRKKRA